MNTPRPSKRTPELIQEAAEKLAVECVEWAGEGDAKDWVDDLIKCAHYWDNGYELAKALDDRCYVMGIDSSLVETLDNASYYLDRAHEAAVKQWVQEAGFDPAFAVGDMVECRHGIGPVHRIEADKAQYVVATSDRDWGLGGGYIINAEDLKPASVGTHPEGQDGEAGLVRSMGDATGEVGDAQTPSPITPNGA